MLRVLSVTISDGGARFSALGIHLDGVGAVGVIEGGQIYFIRTDHIGRPSFATNENGVQVWAAGYEPFGAITITSGAAIGLCFPRIRSRNMTLVSIAFLTIATISSGRPNIVTKC